jgi:hypothetical protein
MMMVVVAAPIGITLALQSYYEFHLDRHDAIVVGVVMTTVTAVIGSLFYCLGRFIVFMIKRRRKASS